jgi:hypothetical protein
MQTTKGSDAKAACKAEFQDLMAFLVGPLLVKDVRNKVENNAPCVLEENKARGLRFRRCVSNWRAKLKACYDELAKGSEGLWHKCPTVPMEAYEPTAFPFFLSTDNCTAYSMWESYDKCVHMRRCPVPLL